MMTPRLPIPIARLAPVAVLALLAACNVVPPPQDDPTRFFILSDSGASAQAPAQGGARIALRAVQVGAYLKRREIVVRTGPNEVQFRDYRRWAEPVDAAITRVLRQGLLASPGVSQVIPEPFPLDLQPDYYLSVEVTRFEGMEGPGGRDSAVLSAVFELSTGGPAPKVVARRLFEAPARDWDGRDFDRLAGLLSADVADLAKDIAASVPAP